MNLIALTAFTDNYIRMLHDGHQAVVVDPGELAPVVKARPAHRKVLGAILVTPHGASSFIAREREVNLR